jgi:hypothetical protein
VDTTNSLSSAPRMVRPFVGTKHDAAPATQASEAASRANQDAAATSIQAVARGNIGREAAEALLDGFEVLSAAPRMVRPFVGTKHDAAPATHASEAASRANQDAAGGGGEGGGGEGGDGEGCGGEGGGGEGGGGEGGGGEGGGGEGGGGEGGGGDGDGEGGGGEGCGGDGGGGDDYDSDGFEMNVRMWG